MRFAIVSDIHGNDVALEAALAHAKAQGYDRILDLGDTVSGPLRPLATFERMASYDVVAIAGNHERQLLTLPPEKLNASDAFTTKCLGAERVQTFRARPATKRVEDILMTHGTPSSDLGYLMEDVSSGVPVARRPEDIADSLSGVDKDLKLILCGHSHIQRAVQIDGGPLVVNPGSVGLPAFGNPGFGQAHKMEAGSRHARYAIAERTKTGWSIEFHLVDYDWKTAAADAASIGRHDWAYSIASGFASAKR